MFMQIIIEHRVNNRKTRSLTEKLTKSRRMNRFWIKKACNLIKFEKSSYRSKSSKSLKPFWPFPPTVWNESFKYFRANTSCKLYVPTMISQSARKKKFLFHCCARTNSKTINKKCVAQLISYSANESTRWKLFCLFTALSHVACVIFFDLLFLWLKNFSFSVEKWEKYIFNYIFIC